MVASEIGVSRQHLARLFRRHVGVRPKILARVFRMQQFAELSKRSSQPNWMSLALDAGYYDLAHMINDCRELTGLSPSELRGT